MYGDRRLDRREVLCLIDEIKDKLSQIGVNLYIRRLDAEVCHAANGFRTLSMLISEKLLDCNVLENRIQEVWR